MSEQAKADAVRKRQRAAAQRALAEAQARRGQQQVSEGSLPREIGGRSGPEPTRHGDWEKNGIAIDF